MLKIGFNVDTINTLKIDFDPVKDKSNIKDHGVSLAETTNLDWDTVIAKLDTRHNYGEIREIGYGMMGERLYCVVFVRRGDVLRIISFRKTNRREVLRYVKQTQDFTAND
jgi:uncharacterized protein